MILCHFRLSLALSSWLVHFYCYTWLTKLLVMLLSAFWFTVIFRLGNRAWLQPFLGVTRNISSVAARFITRRCETGAANCALAWQGSKVPRLMGTVRGGWDYMRALVLVLDISAALSFVAQVPPSSACLSSHREFTRLLVPIVVCVSKRLIAATTSWRPDSVHDDSVRTTEITSFIHHVVYSDTFRNDCIFTVHIT
jgi:hypothetical protein